MLESISKFDIYLGLALNGLFSGLGSAIGVYFANKHIVKKSEKLMRRIKRRFKQ